MFDKKYFNQNFFSAVSSDSQGPAENVFINVLKKLYHLQSSE